MAFFSCKKDKANIGANISGNLNEISSEIIDTFHVTTYSKIEDSVITSGTTSPILGVINTSEFGIAKSSLFTSLIPDSLNGVFPSSNFEIDSFYIQLHITNLYGKNIDQEFEVYKIKEVINAEEIYYNFDSLSVGEKLGSFILNVPDSGIYKFDLDSSAANYLLSDVSSNYTSNESFKNFFEGIYITPVNNPSINQGSIYQLNKTGISLHISFSTTNGMDSKFNTKVKYLVEDENNIFTKFNHNFNSSEVGSVNNDTTLGQEAFYAQGLSGAFGVIEFPSLQKWFDNDSINYLITKYEFTVFAEENPIFQLPSQLIFTYISSSGNRNYKTAILNSDENSYTFEIYNAEVNTSLENGKFNQMNFEISHPFPATSPEQVKIFGSNSESPPKLKISFTSY